MSNQVVRLKPLHYIHVKDLNQGSIRVVTGPRTFTTEEYEEVVLSPTKMVIVPPGHYVVIDDPVLVDHQTKKIVFDERGQAQIRPGNQEVRFEQAPFVLYPGESCGKVTPLTIVEAESALCLRAKRDFQDMYDNNRERKAGEEWLFKGPGVYLPQVEIQVLSTVRPIIVKQNQALRIKATDDCVDHEGRERKAGEEWLVFRLGAYLPTPQQQATLIDAIILDNSTGRYVRAKKTFIDDLGKKHKAGEEWLVTREDFEVYFPGIDEEVFQTVLREVVEENQFCVIGNPRGENGKIQLGAKELRKGPLSFFLFPGETILAKQNAVILAADQMLTLQAKEEFRDEFGSLHKPGDEFYIYGPQKFITPIEAQIKLQSRALLCLPGEYYVFNAAYVILGFLASIYFLYKLL